MIVSKHTQAAPATAYALTVLHNLRTFEFGDQDREPLSLALLTIAADADRALYSGDGYNGHTPEQVAELLDLSVPETTAAMDRLREVTYLDPDVFPGGRYRIPQVAYDRSNGEVDTESSASRQHYIETGQYLTHAEVAEYATN